MAESTTSFGLNNEGCRGRQARLAKSLAAAGMDAALLKSAKYVHAYSGFWTRNVFQSVLLIRSDGSTILAAPFDPPEKVFVDETTVFPAAKLATLVDDQMAAAIQALSAPLRELEQIGSDQPAKDMQDIQPILRSLHRTKLPDEIAMIERSIAGCQAAYAHARQIIRPGLMELDLYAEVLAAATRAVGEPIGELGNDFQSGTPGGPPRSRPMQAGELIPLDLSVVVRGYYCDLCRTFAVDSKPTSAQRDAHRRAMEVLQFVEKSARPGVSCRQLYHDAAAKLDGYRGWRFPHHLGHGIGLSPHESPRLNPNWDDVLQPGDVFAAEPGLYSDELGGGVRLERDYLVTTDGVRALCSFPLDL